MKRGSVWCWWCQKQTGFWRAYKWRSRGWCPLEFARQNVVQYCAGLKTEVNKYNDLTKELLKMFVMMTRPEFTTGKILKFIMHKYSIRSFLNLISVYCGKFDFIYNTSCSRLYIFLYMICVLFVRIYRSLACFYLCVN